MKKKILISVASVCFIGFGVLLFANGPEPQPENPGPTTPPGETNTKGCINQPGKNDGHCATDGIHYLCENKGTKDCVKGQYP